MSARDSSTMIASTSTSSSTSISDTTKSLTVIINTISTVAAPDPVRTILIMAWFAVAVGASPALSKVCMAAAEDRKSREHDG